MLRFIAASGILDKVFINRNVSCPCGTGRPVAIIMQIGQRARPKLPKMIPNLTPYLSLSLLQKPMVINWTIALPILT